MRALLLAVTLLGASCVPITLHDVHKDVTQLPDQESCATFADLATIHVSNQFDALLPELSSVLGNTDIKPKDVKDIRDKMLEIRTMLDIFSPVYPNTGLAITDTQTRTIETETYDSTYNVEVSIGETFSSEKDPWRQIRKDFDIGYVELGEYKDMKNVDSPKETKKRLEEVLEWYQKFIENSEANQYSAFINNIDPVNFHDHKKHSKFFWPKGVMPSTEVGGLKNLEMLVTIQLREMLERQEQVMGMKSILDVKSHEKFHNFRKAVRAILHEAKLFGSTLIPATVGAEVQLDKLRTLYNDYGKVNDKWTEYDIKKKHGPLKDLKKLEEEIQQDFDKLKEMQTKMNLAVATAILFHILPTACSL